GGPARAARARLPGRPRRIGAGHLHVRPDGHRRDAGAGHDDRWALGASQPAISVKLCLVSRSGMSLRPSVCMLVVGYTSFLILGACDGQLGVAWPSMRNTFGLSLDAVGMLLIAGTVGFSLASILSGGLIARWGAGVFLLGAS